VCASGCKRCCRLQSWPTPFTATRSLAQGSPLIILSAVVFAHVHFGWRRLGEWAVAELVASLGLVPQVGACLCLVAHLVILCAHVQSACLGAGAEAFTCASQGLREGIGGKEQMSAWLYTVSANIFGEFPDPRVCARTRSLCLRLLPAAFASSPRHAERTRALPTTVCLLPPCRQAARRGWQSRGRQLQARRALDLVSHTVGL
jgi:hypothetical protein